MEVVGVLRWVLYWLFPDLRWREDLKSLFKYLKKG